MSQILKDHLDLPHSLSSHCGSRMNIIILKGHTDKQMLTEYCVMILFPRWRWTHVGTHVWLKKNIGAIYYMKQKTTQYSCNLIYTLYVLKMYKIWQLIVFSFSLLFSIAPVVKNKRIRRKIADIYHNKSNKNHKKHSLNRQGFTFIIVHTHTLYTLRIHIGCKGWIISIYYKIRQDPAPYTVVVIIIYVCLIFLFTMKKKIKHFYLYFCLDRRIVWPCKQITNNKPPGELGRTSGFRLIRKQKVKNHNISLPLPGQRLKMKFNTTFLWMFEYYFSHEINIYHEL